MKDLGQHEIEQILQLINGSTYDQVSIEIGDLKIQVARNGASALPRAGALHRDTTTEQPEVSARPAAALAPSVNHSAPPAAVTAKTAVGLHVVKAPMLGVFYRASQPEAEPFVKPGARVSATDTICLLEVMKLFQSISAGVEGTIKEILVESGALVEFGQPLFLMELAGADLNDLEDPETLGRSDLV